MAVGVALCILGAVTLALAGGGGVFRLPLQCRQRCGGEPGEEGTLIIKKACRIQRGKIGERVNGFPLFPLV